MSDSVTTTQEQINIEIIAEINDPRNAPCPKEFREGLRVARAIVNRIYDDKKLQILNPSNLTGLESAPERIYLVREDDCNHAHDETNSTWCSDRISKEDIEYVRADLCKINQ